MKRRLLMAFVAAGLMISMALNFSSCKKTEDNANLGSIPTVDTPMYGDRDAYLVCPYCGVHVGPGVLDHIHYFGPGGTVPVGTVPQDHLYPVDYCNTAFEPDDEGNIQVCPYSGDLEGDPDMIAYLMVRYGYTEAQAATMLLPRFHRHRILYDLFGADGGTGNHWHVGGGSSN